MSRYLPYGGFKWLKSVDKFDVNSISENRSIGYILQTDLEYPDKLHVLHNDYPLAPEKHAITYYMLSDFCKEIADEYEIKVGDVKQFIPNLGRKFHRVLKFRKFDWMKKYIDFNTEKRTNAANSFEKKIKLIIDSVYGKRMENL